MGETETRATRIEATLRARFDPQALTVVDQSGEHAGHAGAQPAGETHYHVAMVAAGFTGMGRVERSRAVHAVLSGEFASGLHALALRLRAPGE